MLLDEICYALLLPHWQTTTKWPNCSLFRSFQSSKFVHQHKAQGLHIGLARTIGVSNFGLELERCVPNRLIEEKQPRADSGAADPRSWIEPPILQIDIEISDTRQYAWGLPGVEPMPGRDEHQLAIELAQCRFW